MDNLIYDRLLSDVEEALNNQNSTENLKGAYNYTDLNRIETWCKYIKEILQDYGLNKNLETKINWNMRDYPTMAHIDRIRGNIQILKEFCEGLTTETIVYNNTLNYEQANILEKILFDINAYFENVHSKLNLEENVGFYLINKKYINLTE